MRQSRSSVSTKPGASGTRPAGRLRTSPPWLGGTARAATLLVAAALMASASPVGARGQGRSAPPAEGRLVSATLVQRLPAASVRAELDAARAEPGGPVLGGGAVRYGVAAYDVRYRTVNALGQPVVASGLVAFPEGGPATLPLVTYSHGTTATRINVPSTFGLGPDKAVEGRWTAELFASAGFAVTAPDYVGMGTGTGPVQYLVAKSEASASADLPLAARTLTERLHRALEPGVLVTGFSQGGSAAMALGRTLNGGGVPGFRLRALAPISGPYELVAAQLPGIFNGQVSPLIAPYYVAYTLTSWNRLYHLYAKPDVAFRAPYAATVNALFDGSHSDESIIAALPTDIDALLTPKFLGLTRDPRGRFLHDLTVNSTCWTPPVPVRLYAASGDTTVPQANALDCAAAIRAHGGRVQVNQLGHVDHENSAILALPRILSWFTGLRQATPASLPVSSLRRAFVVKS